MSEDKNLIYSFVTEVGQDINVAQDIFKKCV